MPPALDLDLDLDFEVAGYLEEVDPDPDPDAAVVVSRPFMLIDGMAVVYVVVMNLIDY